MPVYKYKKTVTEGPFGTVSDFNPSTNTQPGDGDTAGTGEGKVSYRRIYTADDGTSYVYIEDASDLVEQSGAIGWTEVAAADYPDGVLDQYKTEALAAVKETLAGLIDSNVNNDLYFTSSLGFKVNGDFRSYVNLVALQNSFDADADSVEFRDYDNETHELGTDDIVTLENELTENIKLLQLQKWDKEEAINAAGDLDTVFSLSKSYDMSDFTEN